MRPQKGDNLLSLSLAVARLSLDTIAAHATDPVAAAAKKAKTVLDTAIAAEQEEAGANWEAREEEEEAARQEAAEEEARQEAADEEAILDYQAREAGWKPDEEQAREAHWRRIAEFGGWDHGKGAP